MELQLYNEAAVAAVWNHRPPADKSAECFDTSSAMSIDECWEETSTIETNQWPDPLTSINKLVDMFKAMSLSEETDECWEERTTIETNQWPDPLTSINKLVDLFKAMSLSEETDECWEERTTIETNQWPDPLTSINKLVDMFKAMSLSEPERGRFLTWKQMRPVKRCRSQRPKIILKRCQYKKLRGSITRFQSWKQRKVVKRCRSQRPKIAVIRCWPKGPKVSVLLPAVESPIVNLHCHITTLDSSSTTCSGAGGTVSYSNTTRVFGMKNEYVHITKQF